MISEAAPADLADYYYTPGDSLFQQTTIQAFRDAGINIEKSKRKMIAEDIKNAMNPAVN
jgi:hypothetical protein